MALGPPQTMSKGLAGGPARPSLIGGVGQGLDPRIWEGEAGRERCSPERLSIAWMVGEGARDPWWGRVGFPRF